MKVLKRVGWAVLAILFACPVPVSADVSQAGCELCIVELQTQGISSAAEEYIVLQNRTTAAYDLTGIAVRYFTAAGNPNTKTISLSGLLAPEAELAFVSDNLKIANPTLGVFPTGLAFADAGGTVQITKNDTILDQVGWGTAALREGSSAPAHDKGHSLIRQNSLGFTDDTGDNVVDFSVKVQACFGLSLNEIQPHLIGINGEDVEPFIEILKTIQANTTEDCPLSINGVTYDIAAGDIANGNLIEITSVLDANNQQISLALLPEATNNFQFVPQSLFGPVHVPGAALAQSTVLSGQSSAKFGTTWKSTHTVTPAAANIFSTVQPTSSGETNLNDPTACEGVIMTELLPNAIGDDSGQEWIELYNTTGDVIFLANCKIVVNGSEYGFNPDQFLDTGEYNHLTDFIDGTSLKTLTLKNTDVNTVSFGRKFSGFEFEAIQTIQYENAPEGQSWARFDDGWRWSSTPTPSSVNQLAGKGSGEQTVTEFAAVLSSGGGNQALPATTSAAIQIVELLPNPASPGSDENDEYVELYNPTDQQVNLTGYKVQTGTNYNYSFTITDQSIAPKSYLILTSGKTSLTLSNSGGRARLLDPNGALASETDAYSEAKEGNAWVYVNGTWQWTSTPTPASANVVVVPIVLASKTTKSSTKKSKATTKKPATAKAAKAAKTTKAKATSSTDDFAETQQPGKLHPGIIAGVGILAVGYAAYEYRRDIANRYYQLKRYRAARRTSGK